MIGYIFVTDQMIAGVSGAQHSGHERARYCCWCCRWWPEQVNNMSWHQNTHGAIIAVSGCSWQWTQWPAWACGHVWPVMAVMVSLCFLNLRNQHHSNPQCVCHLVQFICLPLCSYLKIQSMALLKQYNEVVELWTGFCVSFIIFPFIWYILTVVSFTFKFYLNFFFFQSNCVLTI